MQLTPPRAVTPFVPSIRVFYPSTWLMSIKIYRTTKFNLRMTTIGWQSTGLDRDAALTRRPRAASVVNKHEGETEHELGFFACRSLGTVTATMSRV